MVYCSPWSDAALDPPKPHIIAYEQDAEYDKDGCDFEDDDDVPEGDGEMAGSGAPTPSTATAEAPGLEGKLSAADVDAEAPMAQRVRRP